MKKWKRALKGTYKMVKMFTSKIQSFYIEGVLSVASCLGVSKSMLLLFIPSRRLRIGVLLKSIEEETLGGFPAANIGSDVVVNTGRSLIVVGVDVVAALVQMSMSCWGSDVATFETSGCAFQSRTFCIR